MAEEYLKLPPFPKNAWNEIYRINKRGNEAIVKVRGDEIQVLERETKIKYRTTISTEV